jgi:23S rRNA (adenine2030-N6)-methyltransferase
MKSDYARVVACTTDAVRLCHRHPRLVPIIPRPKHTRPAAQAENPGSIAAHWLHATLTVKSSKLTTDSEGEVDSPPPPASGMFIINPPHTLKADLQRRAAADGRTAGPGPQCRLHLEHGG